ncbi:metal ABC transporter solute-binding protein, Zn/Mn family [Bounagaea algeriensis]
MTVRAHLARRKNRFTTTALAGVTTTALVLSGCGSGTQGEDSDGELSVVASTDVWGSVVRAVGGDQVDVESIIDDPATDPHSYESTPRDAATISDADLVLSNGGGYDGFMPQILAATGERKPTIQAFDGEHDHGGHGHGGHDHGGQQNRHAEHGGQQGGSPQQHDHGGHGHGGHDHGGENEHVWYEPHAVADVSSEIAAKLGELRPQSAEQFRHNAERFEQQIDQLDNRIGEIREQHRGEQVIATAPVADLLVERAGLRDITPQEFVNAVEAENSPSAAAVAAIDDAVSSGRASAVIHNPQTETPVTRKVLRKAEDNGIPVVPMSETLPQEQSDYVPWMSGQVDRLARALDA